jgi:hypothetical protein
MAISIITLKMNIDYQGRVFVDDHAPKKASARHAYD